MIFDAHWNVRRLGRLAGYDAAWARCPEMSLIELTLRGKRPKRLADAAWTPADVYGIATAGSAADDVNSSPGSITPRLLTARFVGCTILLFTSVRNGRRHLLLRHHVC